MFDFSKLNLVVGAKESFVGIRQSESNDGMYEFCLPHGFDEFKKSSPDFNQVRDFFFLMYRTLRKFERDNATSGRFQKKDSKTQQDQDRPTLSVGGSSLENEDGGECILYSKLTMIERVLEAYDDLAIHSIQNKIRRTEEIDYSQIHKYLERAIYLEDDVIYIETMDLPRPIIRYESTSIVELYCFILDEIVKQLQEDVPENVQRRSQDVKFLSQRFRDAYLTGNQSLFDKDSFEETINILKEAFDQIDKHTYYKDADYWGLYEAIETFLYGQLNPNKDGEEFWGIKGSQGFSFVWEDMCQTYYFKKNLNPQTKRFDNIRFADTDIVIKGHENPQIKANNSNFQRTIADINRIGTYKKNVNLGELNNDSPCNQWLYDSKCNIAHPYKRKFFFRELFCIEWDLNQEEWNQDLKKLCRKDTNPRNFLTRYPQPDLVIEEEDKNITEIIDFKYVNLNFFEKYMNLNLKDIDEKEKYRIDVEKQLVYELALQQSFPERMIHNMFFIPFFFSDRIEKELGQEDKRTIQGIKIFKGNFLYIQNFYIDSWY